jgi:UDP-glucose 4-epimerase
MTEPPLTWVVGRGGLLGAAVEKAVARQAVIWAPTTHIPWADPEVSSRSLARQLADFMCAAAAGPWQVLWCAGVGVTGSAQETLDAELLVWETFLEALSGVAARARRRGLLFMASSAGGVYAGSPSIAPYDETSVVGPLAPYGRAKLRAEAEALEWSSSAGVPVLVGRIANLYGPGQNLGKGQGLISQMCKAHLTGQPLSIYVPLDTVRDYLFVDDAGRMVADGLRMLRQDAAVGGTAPVVTKVFASQRGTTLAAVLGELRRVFKRAPRIVLGSSPTSAFQAKDLRLGSCVWPRIDARPKTPLAVGVKLTSLDLLRQLQLTSV